MKTHHSQLYFVFGLWVSFASFLMAGITLLPQRPDGVRLAAGVYGSAAPEELHESSVITHIGKAILVDEASKKVTLYENDREGRSFSLHSLPRVGSAWEAPSGKYAIEKKEYKHFSPLSGSWMPYSIEITRNFFIHGERAGGEDGNGSLELSTSDAKAVFDFADIGTQVIVTGASSRDAFASSPHYSLLGRGALPLVTATSFIVADIDSGEVLWERDAERPLDPGSLVSLPTALTAVEHINPYKTVRIGEIVLDPSVRHRFVPSRDDELELGSLIYPLLFATNDTAGKTFEKIIGTQEFVSLMNEKSKEIGMEHSHYSSALSGGATTTAHDLFALLAYIDREQHFLIDVSLREESSVYATSGRKRLHWENKNPWVLAGDGRYRGGLSQEDANGNGSGALIFSLPVSEFNDRSVAFIVLDSTDIKHDIAALRTFIGTHYVYGISRTEVASSDALSLSDSLKKKIHDLADFRHLFEADISYDRRL